MALDPSSAESQPLKTNLTDYAQLRTILDSLELGAINHFMKLDGSSGFEELKNKLMEVTEWVWSKPQALDGNPIDCPPGYIDCKGVCVPYPCPY